jgi:hypothetical protein
MKEMMPWFKFVGVGLIVGFVVYSFVGYMAGK